MKRALLSLAAGVFIPFLYFIGFGALAPPIENSRVAFLLWQPISWPITLHYYLANAFSSQHVPSLKGASAVVTMIVCNVALYGGLIYFALWVRSRKPKDYNEPPRPPIFGQPQ